MPLDINLLYGEMAGSWIAHLAIPVAASMLVGVLPYMAPSTKVMIFIGVCTAFSFVCQYGFLAMLQSSSCQGIKDYGSVFRGAVMAALITAGMIAIPAYVEPMRLVVSMMFFDHKALLTPEQAAAQKQIVEAASAIAHQRGGAAITPDEYDDQTFQEIASGASYWAAFAGAYGVGIGSLTAAVCPATA